MGDSSFMMDIQDRIVSGERMEIPDFVPQPYKQIIDACWVNIKEAGSINFF